MDKKDSIVGVADVLAGDASTATLSSGRVVVVKVCNGKSLPKVLRFVSRVAGDLGLKLSDAELIKNKLLLKIDDVAFILQLIANYTDEVYSLVVALSDVGNVDAVGELPIDDIILLILKCVQVNSDFFTSRVLPLLPAQLAETRGVAPV